MQGRTRLIVALSGAALLLAPAARAQDTTPTLSASDFTLTLDTGSIVLTSEQLATYFSRARCACPTTLTATLTLNSDAAAKIDVSTLDAQLYDRLRLRQRRGDRVPDDWRNPPVHQQPGSDGHPAERGHLQQRGWRQLHFDDLDSPLGDRACESNVRLQSEPALALTLGGAGPGAPTDVKTVSSDEGLLVSWTASGDASSLQGHQVLCSPGATTPSTASYDTCGVPAADGGAGPFDSLDPQFVCSGLIAIGTTSARIHALENGRTYQIAVVAAGLHSRPARRRRSPGQRRRRRWASAISTANRAAPRRGARSAGRGSGGVSASP